MGNVDLGLCFATRMNLRVDSMNHESDNLLPSLWIFITARTDYIIFHPEQL